MAIREVVSVPPLAPAAEAPTVRKCEGLTLFATGFGRSMRTPRPEATPAYMVPFFLLRNCLWMVAALLLTVGLTTLPGGAQPQTKAAPKGTPVRIVVLGDSLVAGFQIKASEAFPAQLERALKARGHGVEVANAGVSGDTTAGGLERVAWAVPKGTDAVILELGANDALRGLDPARAKANLEKIITQVKAGGAEVLLAGMLAPSNWGEAYAKAFDAIYPGLAGKHGTLLYPFFLDGIVMDGRFNLGDGLHPNAEGVAEIVRRILPTVEELIARVRARQAATGG
jgi:acyl-CoA thioesterase I